MKIVLHQPAYLPWPGLLAKMCFADELVFLDTAQYTDRDYDRRNRIKMPNGQPMWLTVPIVKPEGGHRSVRIVDAVVDNSRDWQAEHWVLS